MAFSKVFTVLCLLVSLNPLAHGTIYPDYLKIGTPRPFDTPPTKGMSAPGLKNTLLSILLTAPAGENFTVEFPELDPIRRQVPGEPVLQSFTRAYYFGLKRPKESNKQTPKHLVFVIPGFGASLKKGAGPFLSELIHRADPNAITLTTHSPANPQFISESSEQGYPGVQKWDAKDLYTGFEKAYKVLKEEYNITKVSVVGASLGSMNAAHLLKWDQHKQKGNGFSFGFHKVISLNPPVSNVYGATVIDTMVAKSFPDQDQFNWTTQLGAFEDAIWDILPQKLRADTFEDVATQSAHAIVDMNDGDFDADELQYLVGFGFAPTVLDALKAGSQRHADGAAGNVGAHTHILTNVRFFTGFLKNVTYRSWKVSNHVPNFRKYPYEPEKYPHFHMTEFESIEDIVPKMQKASGGLSNYHLITWDDDFLLRSTDPQWIETTLSGGEKGTGKVFTNGGGHLGGYWQPEFQAYFLGKLLAD